MRRRVMRLLPLAVVVLGCAGVTEQMVELGGGGQVEVAENGDMVWKMKDGRIMRTRSGTDVEVPADMPMPRPWPDAPAQSVITIESPDGEVGYIVSYEMKRTRHEITPVYDAWYAERGLTPEVKESARLGTWSLVMDAREPDGAQASVTMQDFFGMASVSVVYGKELGEFANR